MHRGEWLKEKIRESGYTYDLVADLLGIDRVTIFRWMKKSDLAYVKMKSVSDVCGFDLTDAFPDSAPLYKDKPKDYRALYLDTLEQLHEVREELSKYKASK